MIKQDREALAEIAAGNVYYKPGRERWTQSPPVSTVHHLSSSPLN